MKRAALILCGGKSSRMGRAKAWLPWFGRSMIEHVALRVGPAVDEVFVVTSEEVDLPPLTARIVRDREPARGPLAGIRDGLAAAAEAGFDLAFVTSTDAPFVNPEFVSKMLAFGRAAAPVDEGFVQVLSAVYPAAAWEQAEELLQADRARPRALLEALDFHPVESDEIEKPFPWQGFNTPQEYLDAARRVRPEATAQVELLGRAALASTERCLSVPVGTLGEILAKLEIADRLELVRDEQVAKPFQVSLGGREWVRDLGAPIGPGERVSILDAQAGG